MKTYQEFVVESMAQILPKIAAVTKKHKKEIQSLKKGSVISDKLVNDLSPILKPILPGSSNTPKDNKIAVMGWLTEYLGL